MRPTEEKIQKDPSDLPIYLFKQGNNCEAYRYFGAHLETRAGESGVVFRVWAPHAAAISVVGDFNSWKPGSHPMRKVDGDSVWELFIPGVKEYDVYKYCVTTRGGDLLYKADPYAFHAETRPSNGSKVYDITGFAWHDDAWQTAQKKADAPAPTRWPVTPSPPARCSPSRPTCRRIWAGTRPLCARSAASSAPTPAPARSAWPSSMRASPSELTQSKRGTAFPAVPLFCWFTAPRPRRSCPAGAPEPQASWGG